MKLKVLIGIGALLISACFSSRNDNKDGQTNLSSRASASSYDLLSESERVLSDLKSKEIFNLKTCPEYLSQVYSTAFQIEPHSFNVEKVKSDWMKIYNNLWLIRSQLNENLKSYGNNKETLVCANKARDFFRLARYIEDYLAESFSGVQQDFDLPKDVKPVIPTPFQDSAPWTVLKPGLKKLTLRSGDIIISRGNAYTSASIARIVEIDSQFSHLAMIYIPNGEKVELTIDEAINSSDVLVLEAHIEIGSTIRPFKDYARDGNARNLLFRYPDRILAHKAALETFRFLDKHRSQARSRDRDRHPLNDVNYSVPYDFKMILNDSSEVFCSEIGYYGFNKVGVQVPTFLSDIDPQLDFAKRLGIKSKTIFAPGDMEVDLKFEMLAEFRNLKKLKGLRLKDMAISGLLKWMKEGYQFAPIPPSTFQSIFAWLTRQLDFKFVKNRLPKNMNIKVLNTTFTLDNVASRLESRLLEFDNSYKRNNNGLLISYSMGLQELERIRVQDRADYLEGRKKPIIHWELRPKDLLPPRQDRN